MSENGVIQNAGRREFLRTAPVAAAAGMALGDASFLAAQATPQVAPSSFKYFPSATIDSDIAALEAKPGSTNLANADIIAGAVDVVVEKQNKAAEFEWHEARDHVMHIMEGSTVYEVGGTPKNPRNIAKGQWRATEAEGTKTITLSKGDVLVVPRNTLHKRNTPQSVAFIMVSSSGTLTA